MAAVHDDDPGFWPGYVAAVSGLVQGLLIMAMALATAIFALGQLARESATGGGGAKPAPTTGGRPLAARAPAPPPPLPARPATRLVDRATVADRAGELTDPAPDARPAAPSGEVRGAAISASFRDDAVTIPVSATAPLLASVDAAQAAGARRWRITIGADLNDPRQQRAAYLRLLGLRALLVHHGLPAGAIDVWIEYEHAGQLSRQARIEPLDAFGLAFPAGARP